MKNVADFEKEIRCLMLFPNVKNIAEIIITLNSQIKKSSTQLDKQIKFCLPKLQKYDKI